MLTGKSQYTSPKAFLYQMYFVINRLDENRLARLEFLVNFGVSLSDIKQIQEAMEYGGTYEEVKQNSFKQLPFLQILKIYKYFSWADKKLHSVFYIENKDDISDDLLSDFKEDSSSKSQSTSHKLSKPQALGPSSVVEALPTNVIVKSDKLVSEHEYLFGTGKKDTKIIDVKSKDDFPPLFDTKKEDTGPLWSQPGQPKKGFGKKTA